MKTRAAHHLTLEELREEHANLERRIESARSEAHPFFTTDQEISDMQEELAAIAEAIGRWTEPPDRVAQLDRAPVS